jgi:hypothetical protein
MYINMAGGLALGQKPIKGKAIGVPLAHPPATKRSFQL